MAPLTYAIANPLRGEAIHNAVSWIASSKPTRDDVPDELKPNDLWASRPLPEPQSGTRDRSLPTRSRLRQGLLALRALMRHLLFLALLAARSVVAQTPVTIELDTFATGLYGIVDIAHAGDDRLFAVLQVGEIRVVNADGTVLPTPFLDIVDQVNSGGEQGLLGLAFDPNYANNGFFYVNYIFGGGAGSTRISRFQVSADPNVADTASEQVIWSWPQPNTNHNGGDLDFGPDGLLYIPLGDGGEPGDVMNNAQDPSDPLGDIIRIDVSDPDTTYTVPPTNPWANAQSDTLPEIWASGLRNPFRFGFDALTGDLWLGDVGEGTFEEVDCWPAGNNTAPNFGWRCYEGNSDFNTVGCLPQTDYVAPVAVHAHNDQGWCSVMGGRVYRGSASHRLYGRYLYTDYCGGQFYALRPDDLGGWVREEVRPLQAIGFTCIAENNMLELFASNTSGGILYHIVDPCPMAPPVGSLDAGVLSSSEANGNQWYLDGAPIPGATGQTYSPAASGSYYVVVDMGGGCELASEAIVYIVTSVEATGLPSVSVHPVPASDRLVVQGLPAEVAMIALLDMTGRAVSTKPTHGHAHVVADMSAIAMGRYVLALRDVDGRVLAQRPVSVVH